jgi:hypothetical protein
VTGKTRTPKAPPDGPQKAPPNGDAESAALRHCGERRTSGQTARRERRQPATSVTGTTRTPKAPPDGLPTAPPDGPPTAPPNGDAESAALRHCGERRTRGQPPKGRCTKDSSTSGHRRTRFYSPTALARRELGPKTFGFHSVEFPSWHSTGRDLLHRGVLRHGEVGPDGCSEGRPWNIECRERSSQGCLQYETLSPTRLGAEANALTSRHFREKPGQKRSGAARRASPGGHPILRLRSGERPPECTHDRPMEESRASARQTPSACGLCVERSRTVIDQRWPPGDPRSL